MNPEGVPSVENQAEKGLPGLDAAIQRRESDIRFDIDLEINTISLSLDENDKGETDWSKGMALAAQAVRAGIMPDAWSEDNRNELAAEIKQRFEDLTELAPADWNPKTDIAKRFELLELLSNSKKAGLEINFGKKDSVLKNWFSDTVMKVSANTHNSLRYAAHLNYLGLWDDVGRNELAHGLSSTVEDPLQGSVGQRALDAARAKRLLGNEFIEDAGVGQAVFEKLNRDVEYDLEGLKNKAHWEEYSRLYVIYKNYLGGTQSFGDDHEINPVDMVQRLEQTEKSLAFTRYAGDLKMIEALEKESSAPIPTSETTSSETVSATSEAGGELDFDLFASLLLENQNEPETVFSSPNSGEEVIIDPATLSELENAPTLSTEPAPEKAQPDEQILAEEENIHSFLEALDKGWVEALSDLSNQDLFAEMKQVYGALGQPVRGSEKIVALSAAQEAELVQVNEYISRVVDLNDPALVTQSYGDIVQDARQFFVGYRADPDLQQQEKLVPATYLENSLREYALLLELIERAQENASTLEPEPQPAPAEQSPTVYDVLTSWLEHARQKMEVRQPAAKPTSETAVAEQVLLEMAAEQQPSRRNKKAKKKKQLKQLPVEEDKKKRSKSNKPTRGGKREVGDL